VEADVFRWFNDHQLVNQKDEKMPGKKRHNLPPDRNVPKILLNYEEAAWSLGISQSKLYALVSRGKVQVVVDGGSTLFRPQDLEKWAANRVIVKNQISMAASIG